MPTVCNGKFDDEVRPGWTRVCPKCNKDIRYTVLNLTPGEDIYLYSNKTSDFLLLNRGCFFGEGYRNEGSLEGVDKYYSQLENSNILCPTGGIFKIWSNIKCPNCHYEFPYNRGIADKSVRFTESKVIWLEGAIIYRGASENSSRLIRVFV